MNRVEDTAWRRPPRTTGWHGRTRMVGFEIEYSGVGIEDAAEIVRRVFGGRVIRHTRYEYEITQAELGPIRVEIDSGLLQDMARRHEIEPPDEGLDLMGWVDEIVESVTLALAPFEVSTPPMPLERMPMVDALREELRLAGAQGVDASSLHAFAMQMNPEAPALDPNTLAAHLGAFLMLEDWLRTRTRVSLARRISPYVDRFPADYARLLLGGPAPDLAGLIDGYLAHNPTRNRPLDMLPVFAWLDEPRVKSRLADSYNQTHVKKRPAFHYRLPSSRVDNPDWRIAHEWNLWIEVERLAASPGRFEAMRPEYLRWLDNPLRLITDEWAEKVQAWLEEMPDDAP